MLIEVASAQTCHERRLSFFLWSSIPDDQLLNIAANGRLKDPVVLEQQVKRMLADTKAKALQEKMQALGCRENELEETFFRKSGVAIYHPPSGVRIRCSRLLRAPTRVGDTRAAAR